MNTGEGSASSDIDALWGIDDLMDPAPGEVSKERKVIIADDSETFIMYLGILMKRLGFRIIPARNGVEVLKLAMIFKPDLILLDVSMPIMDGPTTLRHMKGDEGLAAIPVVMVSVRDDEATYERCAELGCAGYLAKPVSVSELYDVVSTSVAYPDRERRRFIRIPFNRRVGVRGPKGDTSYAAVSLSRGGVYLRSKDPYPVDTGLSLSVPLDDGSVLSVDGKVIYSKETYTDIHVIDPGIAVEFVDLSAEDAAALDAYIHKTVAGDLVAEQDEPVVRPENWDI